MQERREPVRVLLAAEHGEGEPHLRAIAGVELSLVPQGSAQFEEAIREADVVIAAGLTPVQMENATSAVVIHTPGTGVERFPIELLPDGCALCNTHGHENSLAEWALMGMLALSRGLLVADRQIREGDWSMRNLVESPTRDIRGRTVGLIGYGHIGKRTAELARAVGMKTVAVTRTPAASSPEGLEWLGGLDRLMPLLEASDFAVASLPLAPETKDLIGEAELRALGPDGSLLNVGRGPVVNEEALFAALRDRTIASAAIDVWYQPPVPPGERGLPSTYPFWELDNVIMTPHFAGLSQDSTEARWAFLTAQIGRVASGAPLENVVAVGGHHARSSTS
jgi:phosphoglycerate dehydrogenase-like enzyme